MVGGFHGAGQDGEGADAASRTPTSATARRITSATRMVKESGEFFYGHRGFLPEIAWSTWRVQDY